MLMFMFMLMLMLPRQVMLMLPSHHRGSLPCLLEVRLLVGLARANGGLVHSPSINRPKLPCFFLLPFYFHLISPSASSPMAPQSLERPHSGHTEVHHTWHLSAIARSHNARRRSFCLTCLLPLPCLKTQGSAGRVQYKV